MSGHFSLPVRVYYEDTDAGGVVYHSNYLNFMERARTEWLRALGFEQDQLRDREGVLFAVRSVTVDFLKPARFNDALSVSVRLGKHGAASLMLAQTIERGDEVLSRGDVRVACIDASRFQPCPIPAVVSAAIEKWSQA